MLNFPRAALALLVGFGCATQAVPHTQTGNDAGGPILRSSDVPLKAIDARLFRAILVGDPSKVGFLLNKGADANAQDERDVTALELAANSPYHSLQIIEKLLSHGANINYRGLSGGSNLLMDSIENHPKNLSLIKYLLDRGANVNNENRIGDTPLSFAVRSGSAEIVSLLIKRGASVNPPNRNPLSDFVFPDNGQGVSLTACGNTPLFEIFANWSPKVLDLLVSAGANLNERDPGGFNVIHYAIWADNVDALRLLATKGVNVNFASNRGYTPLHFAIANPPGLPDPQIVRALLDLGANPKLATHSGKTAEDLLRDLVQDRNLADIGNAILKELDPAATPFHSEK